MKFCFPPFVYDDTSTVGFTQNAPSDPSTLQPHKLCNDCTQKNKSCKHGVIVSLVNLLALRSTIEIRLWCVCEGFCTLSSLRREVLPFMWMTLLHEKISD